MAYPHIFLPDPITDNWDWQLHAQCRLEPTEVFYPSTVPRGRRRRELESRAKNVCSQCPVLEACRDYAIASAEPFGIWGGLTASERSIVRRKR